MFEGLSKSGSVVEKSTENTVDSGESNGLVSDELGIELVEKVDSNKPFSESLRKFGKLAPLLFSLTACASVERNHDARAETGDYEKLPTHMVEKLIEQFGFTKEVSDSCHLQFDKEAVSEEDILPILHIAQVHPPFSLWSNRDEYEADQDNDPMKDFHNDVFSVLPKNQESIKNILGSMYENKNEPITVMPEGIFNTSLPVLEEIRDIVDGIKKQLSQISSEADLLKYWHTIKQFPLYTEENPSGPTGYNNLFTSETVNLFLEKIQNSPASAHSIELQSLHNELINHPQNLNQNDWSWYVGGAMSAFMNGWVNIKAVDSEKISRELGGVIAEAYDKVEVGQETDALDQTYFELQQQRDRIIIDGVKNEGGGVLIMGIDHSYDKFGAVTCVPKVDK